MKTKLISVNSVSLSLLVLLMACGGGKNLLFQDVKDEQSVKIFYKDGSVDNGIVQKSADGIIEYVSDRDHEKHRRTYSDIRRIEKLKLSYDYSAYPISKAEINKVKDNRNTWGYAIGGVFIGAATGLAVGLPLWLADIDAIPPYFWAGAGAVAGSIFFAVKGQEKDKEMAVRKIRFIRKTDREIEKEIEQEKEQLKEIQDEKEKLKEKLDRRDQVE
jgi:hypothetical protein